MNFKEIKTTGHRRSGTHYITALISINFLNNYTYNEIYNNHKPPQRMNIKKNKDTAIFYIWRNFKDVSKSIFVMRERFGMDENDYNKFIERKYKNMFSNKLNPIIKNENFNNSKIIKTIGGGLKNIDMTPYEFWKFDLERWKKCSKNNNNVYLICYDDIINNFENEMLNISKFLGSDLKKFKNIDKKIGWRSIKNG